MRANGCDCGGLDAGVRDQLQRGPCKAVGNAGVQNPEVVDADGTIGILGDGQQPGAQVIGIRKRSGRKNPAVRVEADEGGINTVRAGTGNQSDVEAVGRRLRAITHRLSRASGLSALSSASCAIIGLVCALKRASSDFGSGSGLGMVTVSGFWCTPLTRNS